METQDAALVHEVVGRHAHARQVDGQEPVATQGVRGAVDEQRRGDREDRVEAVVREVEPVDNESREVPERDADQQPERHLQKEHRHEAEERRPRCLDQRQETDRQEDRHRVVAAGLELEHAPEALREPDPARAHHREHGRRVGARHDRAQEQPLERGEAQERHRDQADDGGGDGDGQRRQADAEREHRTDGGPARVEAAREEDQRERRHADGLRPGRIVEGDAPEPLRAREHADQQEQGEARDADAPRCLARHDGEEQHDAERQQNGTDRAQARPPVAVGRTQPVASLMAVGPRPSGEPPRRAGRNPARPPGRGP